MCCSTIGKIRKIESGIGFIEDYPAVFKAIAVIVIVGLAIWTFILCQTGIEAVF